MKKTLYIMVPNDLPKDMIFDMLEMRFDITMFETPEKGRESVAEADNDPDQGYVVGVTFDIRDANGVLVDADDDGYGQENAEAIDRAYEMGDDA